ncbi:dihydroorotase and related cyclic amidohydrolases [Thiohalobacter thiocyanaticus]|uniref:Dihydroorotase and related cyclic amidohydrolases n=1 Tax=Thiohalobacter thiocyanaticus TaxID=585455 RepID=A0A1Z4VQ70_9GAMM|nr:dihydroorotase and related cyclic amidohydrolases [Thiohalobacter thiocyanaticus]
MGGEDKSKPAPAQRQIMPYPENDAVIQEFRRRFADAGNPIPSHSQILRAEVATLARLTAGRLPISWNNMLGVDPYVRRAWICIYGGRDAIER